ncbi:predicted protein [Arabidopsis lyrata subsp. lyrata]|uniref:Predicted protein n=1 Tax=Arabidopsis lyrata subsp. lyrata TaxID=81972 RepID=D7KSX8_ARALL|nr:predicted protein [Arabidopsis lyrata subsp. lyrata]
MSLTIDLSIFAIKGFLEASILKGFALTVTFWQNGFAFARCPSSHKLFDRRSIYFSIQ